MRYVSIIVVILALGSCKKYLEVGPPANQLTNETVFTSDATAIAAQSAIYAQMEAGGYSHSLLVYTGTASDEGINHATSADAVGIASNNILPANGTVNAMWGNWYKLIYQSNALLEGLEKSTSLSQHVRTYLEGEALFTRAFCHFYLVNLFGAIPYLKTTDYRLNAIAGRDDVLVIYNNLLDDLNRAKTLLPSTYMSPTFTVSTERVRPNKAVASAFLARVNLYMGEWAKAETEASLVISSTGYNLLPSPVGVFDKNNQEAIWQWMATLTRFNSYTGGSLVPSANPTSTTLTTGMMAAFETNDLRKTHWTKNIVSGTQQYNFPFKYKIGQNAATITEYTTVIRLAEMFLIRAEARLRSGNLSGCISDINRVRNRAGLPNTSAVNETQLMMAIRQERRVELFSEFGDRWFDLKRTGQINAVMSILKPSNWVATDALFPIPQIELDRNLQLTQNPGY